MKNYKKILIWTKKGGCGKTNISAELSLRLKYPAITNEEESMLSVVIPDKKLLILDEKQHVPCIDNGVIFDFGGYIDDRVIEAVKQSNITIIPTLPEASDVQGCISTIQALKKYTDKILVIVNKTEHKTDFIDVKNTILKIGNYPIFEIKKSRALPNIYIEKKSIKEMMESKALLRYAYKKVSEQFDDIIKYIFNDY